MSNQTRREVQSAPFALIRAVQTWVDSHPFTRFLRALATEIQEDDVFGMAAEMAYRFLFALFPLLLFLIAALGFLGSFFGLERLFDGLMEQVQPFLPVQVGNVIDRYVSGLLGTRSTAFLSVGLLGTLWGAAGGVGTLIKGLNRAYDIERARPFWRRQLLALATTLVLPPTALILLTLSVLGRDLISWLGQWFGLGERLSEVVTMARWPMLILLLFLGISVLYHVLPNTPRKYRWSLPGSALATAGWLLLSQGFGLYLSHFGNYDTTYGSFGAAIVFLLWLYLVGVLVLLGGEVNSLLEPDRRTWSSEQRNGLLTDDDDALADRSAPGQMARSNTHRLARMEPHPMPDAPVTDES